jgi:hypothetical protein
MRDDGDAVRAKPGVLIINHEESNFALFAMAPVLEGYPVYLVTNAEQGLRVLQQATHGCILLVQLGPFRDMWDLLKAFHENPQLRANHRIIVVDVPGHLEIARQLEPDDMLALPPTALQLSEALGRNWSIMRHSKAS